jgi:hypothetical protein
MTMTSACVRACVCVCCCRACVQLQQDTTCQKTGMTSPGCNDVSVLFSFFSTGCLLEVRGTFMPSDKFMPRRRSIHLAHHCKQSHLRWCVRRLCVHAAVHVAHQCTCTTCTKATHRMLHGTTTSPMPPGMDDGLIWSCDPWKRHACQVSWCNTLLPIGPFFVWSDDDALCAAATMRGLLLYGRGCRGTYLTLHQTSHRYIE